MFGIFETLLEITRNGGPLIYVIWLGMFAGPAWILLSSIPLAFKIRIPAAVILFPGFAMAWVGSYGTIQGLSMAQAAVSATTVDMKGAMGASGLSVAAHTETFGWAVAAALFVWAAFVMGIMSAIGAGKGSTFRWKNLLLVLIGGAGLCAAAFGLMIANTPSWNGDMVAGGLYVSTLSVMLGIALFGLLLSTLRLHPEELRHQSRSLGTRGAIAFCMWIAPLLWLSSAANLSESTAYYGVSSASAEMKQAIMFFSFSEASVWTGLIPGVCALMFGVGLIATLPAIRYGKTFPSVLGTGLMMGLCLISLTLSWTSSSRAEKLLMSSSTRAGTVTVLDTLEKPTVMSGFGDQRWSQKLCALRWDGEGWAGMRWPDQGDGTCAERWESVTLPLPYFSDPTLESTEEAAPAEEAPSAERAKAKKEEGKVGKKDAKMEKAKGNRKELDRKIAEHAGVLGALADHGALDGVLGSNELDPRHGGWGYDPILKVGDQDCGVPLNPSTGPQPGMSTQPFVLAMEYDTPVRHVAETQWHEGGVEEITFIGLKPMGEDASVLPETLLREHMLPLSWKLTWSNHPCTVHPQGSGMSVLVQEHPDGARVERVSEGTRAPEVIVESPDELFAMLTRDTQRFPDEPIHMVLVPGSEWTLNDLNHWCTGHRSGSFNETTPTCVLTDSDRAWRAESFTQSEWELQQARTGTAAAMPSSQGDEDTPDTPQAPGGPVIAAADEVQILGALDRSLIDEVIKRHMNQIRYCYQRELTKNPSLGGKLNVKFVVAKDGTVSSAGKKTSTLNNAGVEQCVTGRFMRMQFPEPKGGGIVIVSYPFVFAPN